MESGNCSQIFFKWFYDSSVKYCRQFEYTGCHGNENKFETRHQCTEICELPKRKGKQFRYSVLTFNLIRYRDFYSKLKKAIFELF
jgi:hypothetical protein